MADFTLSDGTVVHLIGDPHLGKKFEVGVPLARRGEREASQLTHFKRELAAEANIIVMVGDLFDHPYVGYSIAKEASEAYKEAVLARPDVLFVAIAGNHDMPRNIEAIGAFHDFVDRLDGRYSNLRILTKPEIISGLAFFPWEWDRRADEQVSDLRGTVEAAIGHWDLASFGGKDDHLAPVAAIRETFGDIPLYSGHYHVPGDYEVGGGLVCCIGSLEPYTHGEDPNGTLYVTLTRAEALAANSDDLRSKNVRIRLADGEDMPEIDCLSLTFIRQKEGIDEGATPQYQRPTRDWSKVLAGKIAPLDERVQNFITERIHVAEQC